MEDKGPADFGRILENIRATMPFLNEEPLTLSQLDERIQQVYHPSPPPPPLPLPLPHPPRPPPPSPPTWL